jgi:hypothetical protein
LFLLILFTQLRPEPEGGDDVCLRSFGIQSRGQLQPRQEFPLFTLFAMLLVMGISVVPMVMIPISASFLAEVAMLGWIKMSAEAIDPVLRLSEKVGPFFLLMTLGIGGHVEFVRGFRGGVKDGRIVPAVEVSVRFHVEMPSEQFAAVSEGGGKNIL